MNFPERSTQLRLGTGPNVETFRIGASAFICYRSRVVAGMGDNGFYRYRGDVQARTRQNGLHEYVGMVLPSMISG